MPVKFFVQIFQDVIHNFSTPEWSLLQIMHEDLCAKMVMGYSKIGHFVMSAAPLKVKLMVNNVHLQLGFLDVL